MDLGGKELSLCFKQASDHPVPVMAEVTVVSAPPEVTVIGAEAADIPVPVTAVLDVLIAVAGVIEVPV